MLKRTNIIINNNKIYLIEHDKINQTIITAAALYYFGGDIKFNWTAIMDAPIIMQLLKIKKFNRRITINLTDFYYKELNKIKYCFNKEKDCFYFLLLQNKKPLVLKSFCNRLITRYILSCCKYFSNYSMRIVLSEIEQQYVENCIENGQYISLTDILIKEHEQLLQTQQTLTSNNKGDVK